MWMAYVLYVVFVDVGFSAAWSAYWDANDVNVWFYPRRQPSQQQQKKKPPLWNLRALLWKIRGLQVYQVKTTHQNEILHIPTRGVVVVLVKVITLGLIETVDMVIAKDTTTIGIHQEDHMEGVTEGTEIGENGRVLFDALKQNIYLVC